MKAILLLLAAYALVGWNDAQAACVKATADGWVDCQTGKPATPPEPPVKDDSCVQAVRAAHEAYRMGLVQEVVATEELLPRALWIAERVAAQAPLGVQATLASARQAVQQGEAAAAAALPPVMRQLMASEDAAEGVRAMLERRPGNFQGR